MSLIACALLLDPQGLRGKKYVGIDLEIFTSFWQILKRCRRQVTVMTPPCLQTPVWYS